MRVLFGVKLFSVNVFMAVLWAVGKDKLNRDNLNTHICRYIIMCVCVVWCQMFSVNVFMAAFCRQCERQLKHTYIYTYRYVMCVCCCLWMFYGSILRTVGETLAGCLTSQQHVSVSQGRICSDNFTCCHTEIEVADPTFYLTESQYTDAGPTSPNADPITPGACQGSHWSANFLVTGMTQPWKKSRRKRGSNPGSSALEADALTPWSAVQWGGVGRGGVGCSVVWYRTFRVKVFSTGDYCQTTDLQPANQATFESVAGCRVGGWSQFFCCWLEHLLLLAVVGAGRTALWTQWVCC